MNQPFFAMIVPVSSGAGGGGGGVDPGYGRPAWPGWSGNYPSTGPLPPDWSADPGYGRPDWGGEHPGNRPPWAPAHPGNRPPGSWGGEYPGNRPPGSWGGEHPGNRPPGSWGGEYPSNRPPGSWGGEHPGNRPPGSAGGYPSHPIYHPDKPVPPGTSPESGIWVLAYIPGHGWRWVAITPGVPEKPVPEPPAEGGEAEPKPA